jgi:3-oxoacyl-[acyl-carrier-protein] synthase II
MSSSQIPIDSFLILATTVGEIDMLERFFLSGHSGIKESTPSKLLRKTTRLAGVKSPGMVFSCACASSSAAVAQGADLIRSGKKDSVLVVAADSVSEFVLSGFSSLMALDNSSARPFDKGRRGLILGEAAGFILLMSDKRAREEKRKILGEVAGWGLSCDANHMTGPIRDGSGLSRALLKALKSAKVSSSDIGCISAHGTGTLYNDSMEMKAFKKVYKNPIPIYSIKGAIGHTLGAAGLVEAIVALKVLQENIIPATVGLVNIDSEAQNWVSLSSRKLKKGMVILNNCGFGGINAAVILKKE